MAKDVTVKNVVFDRLTLDNTPFYLPGDERLGRHACLLMHGLGGGVYEMKLLGYHLHAQGFSVKGVNYPGHDKPAVRMPELRHAYPAAGQRARAVLAPAARPVAQSAARPGRGESR